MGNAKLSVSRRPQGALMAVAGALACLLGSPAQARDQYCSNRPGLCRLNIEAGFNRNTDTYFWSPNVAPGAAPIDLKGAPFTNKVTRLTLRGSSNVPINANGSPTRAEVLIGSLGTNVLQGGNSSGIGADTFVVGNSPAAVNCQASGVDCIVSGSQGAENDKVVLSAVSGSIIYIDRCLQMTAPYAAHWPGKGGEKIAAAVKASPAEPSFAPITDATGTCPVASIATNSLQATALRGRDALLTPWERLQSITAPWGQGLRWLQQAVADLLQGPRATAALAPVQIPTYEGVARVIQMDPKGNFLRVGGERGSTIVVNAGNLRFNQRILQANPSNGTVYKQIGSKPVPLNRGIAFIYHEPIGVLASYSNDRHPYGSERNRGNVIAQLALGDGTALPARSIDYVLLKNLYSPEGLASVKLATTGHPFSANSWVLLLLLSQLVAPPLAGGRSAAACHARAMRLPFTAYTTTPIPNA